MQVTNPAVLKSVTRKPLQKSKGFTLIELLVVLMIIAIVSGAAVLGVGYFSGRSAVKSVAERLHQVLPLAREYSALHGVVLKLQIEKGHYAFYQLGAKGDQESWRLMTQPNFLTPQDFPNTVLMKLKTHSPFSLNQADEDSLFSRRSIIEILPGLEIEPFVLSIGTEDVPEQYELSVQKTGAVELRQVQ